MEYKGKMAKYSILKKDPIASKHLPTTYWYSECSLEELLKTFSSIYIKPDGGSLGKNIIRVKVIEGNMAQISFEDDTITVNKDEIAPMVKKFMRVDLKYIVQQGIDLATYKERPFDIRVVLQKPFDVWQVTLTSAKVAKMPDSVVTNVARGAKDYLLHQILSIHDQAQAMDPICSMRELIDLSHRTAAVLNSKIPLEILGLDLAIDKKGDLWIIEANVQPSCSKCQLVNDEISVKKYERAKKALYFPHLASGENKHYKTDKSRIKMLLK